MELYTGLLHGHVEGLSFVRLYPVREHTAWHPQCLLSRWPSPRTVRPCLVSPLHGEINLSKTHLQASWFIRAYARVWEVLVSCECLKWAWAEPFVRRSNVTSCRPLPANVLTGSHRTEGEGSFSIFFKCLLLWGGCISHPCTIEDDFNLKRKDHFARSKHAFKRISKPCRWDKWPPHLQGGEHRSVMSRHQWSPRVPLTLDMSELCERAAEPDCTKSGADT